jgi:hypothetical protein
MAIWISNILLTAVNMKLLPHLTNTSRSKQDIKKTCPYDFNRVKSADIAITSPNAIRKK